MLFFFKFPLLMLLLVLIFAFVLSSGTWTESADGRCAIYSSPLSLGLGALPDLLSGGGSRSSSISALPSNSSDTSSSARLVVLSDPRIASSGVAEESSTISSVASPDTDPCTANMTASSLPVIFAVCSVPQDLKCAPSRQLLVRLSTDSQIVEEGN